MTNNSNNTKQFSHALREKRDAGVNLVQRIFAGISFDDAVHVINHHKADLSVTDPNGRTVVHAAAAVGRRDLIVLFRTMSEANFSQRDADGLLAADLAAIVGNDLKLSEFISAIEAERILGPSNPPLRDIQHRMAPS